MKTYYKSGKALKFAEEDVYQNGCQPETESSYMVDIEFTDKTLEGLINKIKNEYGITSDENLLRNSCEENGRLDVQRMEDEDGNLASKYEIEQWKKGKMRLWNACYSYNIVKITEEEVTL